MPGKRNEAETYFLTVASGNYHKNHHGMIKAFLKFKKENPENRIVKLKIIGDTLNAPSDIISKMKDIEFLGRVDDSELINLYQNAYAFIFPSFYEGFGIPPLEAQSCGCPVLASNKASIPEILGESALYFDPFNEEEIVLAMISIIKDENIRLDLIKKGHENIIRFSWEISADKMIELARNMD